MIQVRDEGEGQLLQRLRRYGDLSCRERNEILFLVVKSGLAGGSGGQQAALASLFAKLDDPAAVIDLASSGLVGEGVGPAGTSIESFRDLVDLVRYWHERRGNVSDWHVKLAYQLHLAGICPLACFSFGRCQLGDSVREVDVRRVIEFSVMYLYRVPRRGALVDLTDHQLLSRVGAVSDVFRSADGRRVYKLPKNLAAAELLLPQEMANAVNLAPTKLGPFVPGTFELDERTMTLSHDFVDGPTGEDLLWQGELTAEQQASLRAFHCAYRSIVANGWLLDVHPGNFVWDVADACWKLVDVGSIPAIGREFYDYDQFDDYFEQVWRRRRADMARFPVRSFDFALDLIDRPIWSPPSSLATDRPTDGE